MKKNDSCDEMIYKLANTSSLPEDFDLDDDELPLEIQAEIERIANHCEESERNISEKFNKAYKKLLKIDNWDAQDKDEMIMQAEKDEWNE